MTSRQRILATLNRQPVDRTPVDVWLTPEALDSLRAHTGEDDALQVYRKLGIDKIVWVFPGYNFPGPRDGRNPWGVGKVTVRSGLATYEESRDPPLADFADVAELDAWPLWPDPDRFDFREARQLAERACGNGFATIGPWISHFEIYCAMRGMENALVDLIAEPEFLEACIERIDTIQTRMLERYILEMGDLLDIVFISDDLGTQESQLMAPGTWVAHFKPRLARWCELIHAHGKRVLFHTDGAAQPFIPHFIDCGIDILNPIQHICPGMDRASLKRDFGARVVFHGGVENQHILPHGSPEQVRAEVRACLETLGAGGGYIPASCHNIQAGTPVANILALVEAVHAFGA